MWAQTTFGFPVPFTQILGGMPGYFGTFIGTVVLVLATTDNVPNHKAMAVDMIKIFVVLYIILQNVVAYSVLAALIKNYPDYATPLALCFNIVRVALLHRLCVWQPS